MNSEQGHTLEVDIDEIGAALEPTRMLRLSLEVLWGSLPPDMDTTANSDALRDIDKRICAAPARC